MTLAKLSASPSSASRLGTKLEIHQGVAARQSNSGAWPALKKLLRIRRDRLIGQCAAEQGDEIARTSISH